MSGISKKIQLILTGLLFSVGFQMCTSNDDGKKENNQEGDSEKIV